MKINVHAGHNPTGKIACGVVGFLDESTESRRVKEEVISQLERLGHETYDCTVNDGTGQGDVLKRIVEKCNRQNADLDVSIHFNSHPDGWPENGTAEGTEVYVYSHAGAAKDYAERICEEISRLGFDNRGVKEGSSLYVLRMTKAPALLIECCFADSKEDVQRYDYRSMASAIVYGITGRHVPEETEEPDGSYQSPKEDLYRVQAGTCQNFENAAALQKKLKDAGFESVMIRV